LTREEIARVIRESRLAAGLTQSQVAKGLGRPQQTIANWESGKSQPDANTLFELFRVLGRSVDEAFGFNVESFNVTARERSYIEKYRTLDSYGKGAVDTLLDSEYNRCIEQNLTDYRSRLDQIGEEIRHIQGKAQKSSERTLDDITEEIRDLKNLLGELSGIDHNLDIAIDTLECPLATTGGPQDASASQEGRDIPAPDAPERAQEGG